ncbi:Peroxiredoxin [Filimonas lacunae]|uniref:Peroxiredoxin n=1 Tax=Filimonas lacunae TaxID=477680 RepID=A0A173MQB8_9BACT|nr:TlpA disulfide reductase family protein [Filimonas lacunae]BAV09686.1 thiol:disulfide interchange protein [Filimonas lacunae]SIS77248.1 Peroxiredoxin [Filimonas lacunae]
MKRMIYLLITVALATPVYAQTVHISANIKGLQQQPVQVFYYQGKDMKLDSVKTVNDRFEWTGQTVEAQRMAMMIAGKPTYFFVEGGDIAITGHVDSLNSIKITGSPLQDEATAYAVALKAATDKWKPLRAQWAAATDKEEKARLATDLNEKLDSANRKMREDYIAGHPYSVFSMSLVTDCTVMSDYTVVKASYDLLDSSMLQTGEGRRLTDRLALLKRSSYGQQALDFTQKNAAGEPVQFSSFRGKYVLVDFWASWCGPCRAENPNVLKAYERFQEKGFTVLGVSLDDNRERWLKAVEDDKLPWVQLSDLKGWKNEVSQYYGISGIPSNLLVDPTGKIVGRNLRGEALQAKLAAIFASM